MRVSYAWLFTLHLSFQLESFNFLPRLQCVDGVLMDPMWSVHDKVSVSFDKLLIKVLNYLMEVAQEC